MNLFDIFESNEQDLDEDLRKWFKDKWVRFGPDGEIRGDCARGDDSEGKPKCLPQSKAQSLGKKGRASAAARKRREDPNPERSGKAINVATKKKSNEGVAEAINPDITNPEFSHQQQIGDYLYVARYWSKGLKISAYHGDKQIGYAELMYHSAPFDDFADPKTTPKRIWLESEWTKVNPKYQRQGIMSTMYAYAKMLGNSVKPSEVRSPDAKAAWKSWRDAGDAQHLTREGVAEGSLEEIDRRGFLKGMGAAAVAGAAGGAKANLSDREYQFLVHAVAIIYICNNNNLNIEIDKSQCDSVKNSLKMFAKKSGISSKELNDLYAQQSSEYIRNKDSIHYLKMVSSPKNVETVIKALNQLRPFESVQQGVAESNHSESCPHCGGEMVSEELINEKKDACYYKVKSRYKVWPSAYASGALVKCRKKGADSWGNKSEDVAEDQVNEKWTQKYKDSINCSDPKGFSQKAHCAGKKKNEDIAEGKEYYTVTGTDSASLRRDFNMSKDRNGWHLKEDATPKQKLEAFRAFGSPKLKEFNLAAFSGGTQTKGEDNVISPVGSQTRAQYKK